MYIRRPRTNDPREVEKWQDEVSRQINDAGSIGENEILSWLLIEGRNPEKKELDDIQPEMISMNSQDFRDVLSKVNDIEVKIEMVSIKKELSAIEIINLVYPVGSIYISIIPTNPEILFGLGTWVAFGTGRVLVGIDTGDADFDTVEETGGAKTHKHSVDVASTVSGGPSATIIVASGTGATVATDTHTHTVDPAPVDSTIVSNVMPYIICYFWKRTA